MKGGAIGRLTRLCMTAVLEKIQAANRLPSSVALNAGIHAYNVVKPKTRNIEYLISKASPQE